jgi:hypothetical protein
VCETIGRHVLALETNPIAFREVILPLVKEVEPQENERLGYSLDPNSPPNNRIKRLWFWVSVGDVQKLKDVNKCHEHHMCKHDHMHQS